ncbi:MAG: diacylglycerol kinase [Furfurilactobacillus sp.]|jgi:diacylglycerol kinase (ATP)|uniref:diacylglycerol kinase n=1 Tax=Furfurilactobacillus TaxID=2767882 RepID=UPI001EED926F|nr:MULTISPECIES: diacylglycerol kinase [Furfurilactobacillus]MCF6419729.1 diacylglycerol kinase [Furfurilactobacillus milii]MCH4012633.1 diacylglycerol kinase [Furfurilactobacillus sp.]MCH4036216.1 diacylglycerol kinase [Furfurilactobacillus sp.]MCH4114838.1 diacylglycerol kinase [Furfurilactobacillus sp.]MCH4133585.1 diacylglycerol kinase [Furfurilactobacillus sp.]
MGQRARVIYNPTSGREALKRDLIDILNVFEQAGYETSAYATTPEPDSAKNEAHRAALEGFDLVVAAGGDGTINEVVNGIAGLEKRPKMAIIPAGTTNDYARALRIPRDEPLNAAKVVLKNQTVKMDIGQAGETYFINIAGGGLLTELTYDVPSDMKTIFGYLAYLVKGAELLPQIKPIQMSIEYDDGKFEGEASMFLLGLTNSIGGFEQIVPDASLDDGKFSLLIVKTASMPQLLRLMTLVLNGGRHINDPLVIYKKTSKVIAKPLNSDRMMINLDGEYGGDAPMTFIDHKQHIEMFADLDAIPDEQLTGEDRAIEEDARKFVEEVDKLPEGQTDDTKK